MPAPRNWASSEPPTQASFDRRFGIEVVTWLAGRLS